MVQSAVTENLSMLARYTMQMFISIGLMFYISARLTAVLLSVLPIIVISAVQYGKSPALFNRKDARQEENVYMNGGKMKCFSRSIFEKST